MLALQDIFQRAKAFSEPLLFITGARKQVSRLKTLKIVMIIFTLVHNIPGISRDK